MRPYLVLTAVILMAVAAFAQQPFPHPIYGPYVPLITTPEVSFQQFSPNPVGATNATTGLIAGATNSTLSQMQGSTDSVESVPVWYQGGDAPLTSSRVHLFPESIGREGRIMREERGREEHAREEHGREEARAGWTYFTGREHTEDAALASNAAKGSRKAGHVYTNDDVTRQNDKNGSVKYDGKTEKM
jgi:hypothetical protein